MSDYPPQHGALTLGRRTLSAVLSTLALAISLLLVAVGLPSGVASTLAGPPRAVTSVEVMPAEPDRLLVCMGPALSFGSQGSQGIGYGAPLETIFGLGATLSVLTDTTVVDGFSLESAITSTPPVLVSQPVDEGPLAATSAQLLDNLNVRGLATLECQTPEPEVWLVGGETTTGRQMALSLINPYEVSALIDVDVWGATGPIIAPLGRGILLAPKSQRVISVAGLAPNEPSPVLRVTSAGVGVVASLHYSIVRGLEADGLSVIGSQNPPSTKRVIIGAYSPPEEVLGPIRGKDGYRDVAAMVRLLSPENDTVAQVTVVVAGFPDARINVQLVAGQSQDLLLDEFGSGDLAFVLQADSPVVASLRTSVGTDARTDTDWVGSATSIVGESAFAVPAVGETHLSLFNLGSEALVVTLDGREVQVPAGGLTTRPVSSGSHQLSSGLPFFAAMSVRGETILDSFMVLPTPPRQGSVLVAVR